MDAVQMTAESLGFFTRAQALDAGYGDRAIARAVRSGWWFRFRRGYYTYGDHWRALDPVARHRLRARAVLHSLGPGVVLSHVSAAIEHGIDTWGVPLGRVHVTRLDGHTGRIEGDVVHHTGACTEAEVVVPDGLPLVLPVRAALETALLGHAESALVTLDSALTRGLTTHDDLFARFVTMQRWPDARHLHIPVRMADGGSQSVGESRGRWLFRTAGIPAPVTQFQVTSGDLVVGTCDWGWPEHGLLGEFDGEVKYGRLLKPGQQPGDVVFAEKRREDDLLEITGYRMVRLVWTDDDRPRLTARRVERLLRRSA